MSIDTLALMDEWGPEKVICVSDQRSGMRGVLVIDNTSRGIGKGGTRMSPDLGVVEVARLARTMTWKWAATDLFHGGAKAGILGDPKGRGKEAILRAFARALSNEVPEEYVFGLDMGLTEEDAAIFLDELGSRAAAVGLPHALGGLPYDELGVTGFGVAEAGDAAGQVLGVPLRGARVAIQGFGAVGEATAKRCVELGASVVAVSTSVGAVADHDGLDVAQLIELRAKLGDRCVVEYDVGRQVPLEDVLLADTEFLVPAALQDVIDDDVAARLKAQVVVEGANMPTTPRAKEILFERGVTVVPDFIANAGGVIAAAFSMDARHSPFRVEPEHVFTSVSSRIRANTSTVISESMSEECTPHEAARGLAQRRVLDAMRLRGQIRHRG